MIDTERLAKALSKENLIDCLNSNDEKLVSAAETFLGVCKYPDDYLVMPDYYYPGIRFKHDPELLKNLTEKQRLALDATSADLLLSSQNFSHVSYNAFLSNDASSQIKEIIFETDEKISLETPDGTKISIPWPLFCSLFLKAREFGYSKPSILDEYGPHSKVLKQKWIDNQEKIKELQSKLDD